MKIDELWKRRLIVILEIALVLVIVALVAAIWLPALMGAHPNVTGR